MLQQTIQGTTKPWHKFLFEQKTQEKRLHSIWSKFIWIRFRKILKNKKKKKRKSIVVKRTGEKSVCSSAVFQFRNILCTLYNRVFVQFIWYFLFRSQANRRAREDERIISNTIRCQKINLWVVHSLPFGFKFTSIFVRSLVRSFVGFCFSYLSLRRQGDRFDIKEKLYISNSILCQYDRKTSSKAIAIINAN